GQIGFTEFPPGEREQYPPSHQRLVRRHPGSGRKTLYLSAHASHIVGWPIPDGRLLLHDLDEHATQRQFVYSHRWRVGDLVIWAIATRCIAAGRTTKPSRAICAGQRRSMSARPSTRRRDASPPHPSLPPMGEEGCAGLANEASPTRSWVRGFQRRPPRRRGLPGGGRARAR